MLLRTTFLAIALSSILTRGSGPQWNRIAEENAVIVALIDTLYHGNSALVLKDSTRLHFARADFDPKDSFRALIASRGDSAVLADLYAINKTPRSLEGLKPGRVAFQVTADSSVRNAETRLRLGSSSLQAYWDAVYTRFPGMQGIVTAGRPGFSADHTMAIAEVDMGCGGRCGHGGVFVLRKIDGVWHLAAVLNGITS